MTLLSNHLTDILLAYVESNQAADLLSNIPMNFSISKNAIFSVEYFFVFLTTAS